MGGIRYRERTLEGVLRRAARQFPAIFVTGPRQSGKTTLVRKLFGSTHGYGALDDPAVREQALADPRLLLERLGTPVILDEIQYAPDLLHYVKIDIDSHRSSSGRYILTGSQVFPLMQNVSESLAGRAAVLSLLSMSFAEIRGRPAPETDWRRLVEPSRQRRDAAPTPSIQTSAKLIYRGGFPQPALQRNLDVALWKASYVQSYLERDVRTLRSVSDLADFQRLLVALAVRTGSLVNFADAGRDLGIDEKTVKAWVSVLEASGQVMTLRPYHANLGKRLVKRPKIFFLDTGILSYFLGVRSHGEVLGGMASGPLFEAAVFGELLKLIAHRGEQPRLSFWRTADGHEVDFIIEDGPSLIPVEAKVTATPKPAHAAGIETFQRLFGKRASRGLLVCLCRERYRLTRAVDAVPLSSL